MHFGKQKYKISQKRNGIENGKSHIALERRTWCFSSYKIRKLKVKLWRVKARERKKRTVFVPFILPEEIFLKIFLSQCIVYWMYFQNIYTFKYQKTLLHTLFLLVPQIVECLQCILKLYWWEQGALQTTLIWGGCVGV